MRAFQKALVLALITSFSIQADAYYKYVGSQGGGMTTAPSNGGTSQEDEGSRAAACAPAKGLTDQEWNNVKARIETGGNLWQDRQNSRAGYEVPKGGGVSSIFAGALWLGGKSLDQTLKLAAVTFRTDGNDYWPGPLTTDGSAEVTPQTCVQYDDFALTLRIDAQRHLLWFEMQQNGATQAEIDAIFPDGYSMPAYFNTYPAHGNTVEGQDFYLAPFKDFNENGTYDPENGDYPWYDLLKEIDCKQRRREDQIPLFGDQTYYWIFNDKGNIHSESGGSPIGMEIRAQAFAFTTNDEVNNMTFLNYLLINQGTQTLTETYFGSWVDPDLGSSIDDYVGCDVRRGLGYCYNGDNFDETTTSSLGYGDNPPAVGVDFFEGPYQDADNVDNPLTSDVIEANDENGIPYPGLGIGYGDDVIDNERFGMRRFVYYNNDPQNAVNGDPSTAIHYYNYMQGIWKNNSTMLYGGDGTANNGGIAGLEAHYMFPGDSDPLNWSTLGVPGPEWTEETEDNPVGDRRFIQSAGPFTLAPGDYNNITLGVVWARAFTGNNEASVNLVRLADDKAQSLFDNCFRLVDGPDAPDVAVQELDREIILMLSNESSLSNNFQENYIEFDPSIPEEFTEGEFLTQEERSYVFEGYMVYQLADATVSNSELSNLDKARLIFQTDVKNDVLDLINYVRDETTGLVGPQLMVDAANDGIERSFRITQDAFAQGSSALINHKTYYFMVVAYGFNNYDSYNPVALTGQDEVFKASRKSALGEVQVIAAIPHHPAPEAGGTMINSSYGDGVFLTRLEGKGNGMNNIVITSESEAQILQAPYTVPELTYIPGAGPVGVKVVDPIRVPSADFELRVVDPTDSDGYDYPADTMHWELKNVTDGTSYTSYSSFTTLSEDVVLKYGLSINWGQYQYLDENGQPLRHFTDLIDGSIEFANPDSPWLFGISDVDGLDEFNWIRSGVLQSEDDDPEDQKAYDDYISDDPSTSDVTELMDPRETYEDVLNGYWAPYSLVSYSQRLTNGTWLNSVAPTTLALKGQIPSTWAAALPPSAVEEINNIFHLNNVDIVFTSDKSKWSRCPVLEMQPDSSLAEDDPTIPGIPAKMRLRNRKSVDKNGRDSDDAGYNAAEGDLNGTNGMGWFPGYVIDVGTGERLNVAFGEDSWQVGENGRDMLWNPSSRPQNASGEALFGGQHWIYVFRNLRNADKGSTTLWMPRYDEGAFAYQAFSTDELAIKNLLRACTWVGSSLAFGFLPVEEGLIPTTARVRLRVAQPYKKYSWNDSNVDDPTGSQNGWRNLYKFSTNTVAPIFNNADVMADVMGMINIVPNPYYAFSGYESSKLDNRIKITNLPTQCTISIYTLNGTLIRQFKKADPTTSLDWDLKNHKNIPIASGTYIFHIEVPGVGEKVLKWFGVMRPVDLDNF